MKITKKNSELEVLLEGVKAVCDSHASLSPKVGYAAVRNRDFLKSALKPYWDMKEKIIQEEADETGTVNAKGNPEGFRKVVAAINEIAAEEVEVDIRTVPWSLIGEKDIPLNILSGLDFMMEGEL